MQKSTTDNKFLIKTGSDLDRSEIKPVPIKRFKNESSSPNEAFPKLSHFI
jgi:hypothetical protein